MRRLLKRATDKTQMETMEKTQKLKHEKTTKAIIGSAFEVFNELGLGFLEKVYQRALQAELIQRGHSVELEPALTVKFKGITVGNYAADLLVDEKVIVELKAAQKDNKQDEVQLLNELKASALEVGMLINYGREKVEFKSFIY